MRIRSRVVRGGVWFALLMTASGASAHTAAGWIAVTVLRDCPQVPAESAHVRLVGTALFLTTNALGKATFTVPTGGYQVQAQLAGYFSTTATVFATGGMTIHLRLTLGSNACGTVPPLLAVTPGAPVRDGPPAGGATGTDRVSTGGTHSFYGLVDIRTGAAAVPASCENDRLVQGTAGTADLVANALALNDPSVPCHGAAWIFTANHAPWFDNTTGAFPWTDSGGDVLTVTFQSNRLRIPVTIWLTDFPSKSTYRGDLVTSLLPDANNFLYAQNTGLVLTNSDMADNLPDIVDVGSLPDGANPVPHPVIGKGCSKTSLITKTATVYRPQHLNVYVVDTIEGQPSGVNCVKNGARNVVFVTYSRGFENLLHEIGHGLGLFWPNWGHPDGLIGLYPDNLMVEPVVDGSPELHFSLGQIARMHADASSWLNQPNGIGTVRSRQFPSPFVTACSCPGDAPTLDCPALQADIGGRSGTAYAGSPFRACHMTTNVVTGCLSLAAGGPAGAFTANGWIDTGKSARGFGIYTLESLDPSVATASLDSSTASSLYVNVKGVSNGTTSLLVSLGGVFAGVTVKVGSACP